MKVGQLFREQLVTKIKSGVEENESVFLLSYSELSGDQTSELRKSLRQSGADVYVAKNAIAKRALKDLEKDDLAAEVKGQTAFVWGNTDSAEISKIIVKFTEDFEQLHVQGGLLQGSLLTKNDVKKLSDLPSREVLLATLLGTIQAPVSQLMNALNAKSKDLLSILKQLGEQKEGEK